MKIMNARSDELLNTAYDPRVSNQNINGFRFSYDNSFILRGVASHVDPLYTWHFDTKLSKMPRGPKNPRCVPDIVSKKHSHQWVSDGRFIH